MNYLHPNIEVRSTPDKGRGLFAIGNIAKGEVIEKTTEGVQVLTKEEIARKPNSGLWKSLCYEIGDGREVCPVDIDNPPVSFLMNHSCDPNTGNGKESNEMVAMRDIMAGEEITYDYVTTDSGDYDMECNCGTSLCRGRIRGTDWKMKELQNRYKGYFQKNIQEKIDSLPI